MSLERSKIIYEIDAENIRNMFVIHDQEGFQPLGEREMVIKYQTLIPNDKTMLLVHHMEHDMITQSSKPPFKTVFFKPESRKSISLIYTILGYKNDEEVDEIILGFLEHLHPIAKEAQNRTSLHSYPKI